MLKLRSPGLLIMVASLQLLFFVHVSEYLYPGYSVSTNYISDLGVGPWPSWAIFTVSVLLFGLMILLVASLLYKERQSFLWLFFAISALGAVGVAVFNEDQGWPHTLFSLLAFLFGCLAAIYAFKVTRPPFSYISLGLGLLGLGALILLGSGTYLGLGVGGMERMIFYSGILWALCYGAYLVGHEK